MRVPWSRIYRAFPELDSFSDEECERYVLQVRRQRFGQWKYWLLAAGILMLWTFVVLPAVAVLGSMLGLHVPVIFAACVLLMPLAVFFPAVLLRDRLLIGAIRDRLNLARCTSCGHSLLGLPLLTAPGLVRPQEEAVRCPECGSVMVLRELGLKHAELIPRPDGELYGSPPEGRDVHPAPHA